MNDSKTETPLSVDQESQLSRIAFKAPAFWENDPELWFFQVESQFLLAGISNNSTKFHAVIAALNSNILSCVRDSVKNPPKESAYSSFKDKIVQHFSQSDASRLHLLLHDLQLAPLDELTQIADKVHEVSGSDLTVARIETKSNQIELDGLKAEIADLKNMVKKLTVSAYSPNRNGYRSRSLTSSRVADVSDPIIGADFLEWFELLIDVRNRKLLDGLTSLFVRGTVKQVQSLDLTLVENNSPYNSILSKYTKWFSTNLQPSTNESSVFHCIETKGPPVHARTRRLNLEKLAYLKREFGDLMRQGIIRPSKSSYASPIHFVKKIDGSWRICGDFRRLNSVTIPDRYPLPHIHDFVSGLRQCFSNFQYWRPPFNHNFYRAPLYIIIY
ncbi:transposon Ty3-I Gag-Pol polyprotein [Trichonephila clavipes]|nr:transposon Ty3-I Gag-Pol polyprotein [Trichonephila clavipes]